MSGRRGWIARGRREGGQSAVELALLTPFVILVALVGGQLLLVLRDQLRVQNAARHAAREAAASGALDPAGALESVHQAEPGLRPALLSVRLVRAGPFVRAEVEYRAPTELVLVGALAPSVTLRASVAMRDETGP